MAGDVVFDFIVIGAGIAGASAAASLAPHARTLILEAEPQPGYHTTGRSSALYAESYGGPVVRKLTTGSRAFFDAPPPDFAAAPLLTPRGFLHVATAEQRARLEAMKASLDSTGHAPRLLDGDEVRRLIPIFRPGKIVAGLLDERAMDIDVDALLQGFLRLARQARARLVTDSRVVALTRRDGLWDVATSSGSFVGKVIVNAAGSWAETVGTLAGVAPIGLRPLRRTGVLVDPQPDWAMNDWPAVIDVDEQFVFKPDAGKFYLSPADETPSEPCDAQPEELDIAIAVDRVQQVAEVPVRQINHAWAGLRTFAPDRTPVAGFDAAVEDFFWLAGQGGYGIQTAPALGRLAASLARRAGVPADLAALGIEAGQLAPNRFQENQ